jgi:hypothetical protein
MNRKGCERERVWRNFWCNPGICVEGLWKTTKTRIRIVCVAAEIGPVRRHTTRINLLGSDGKKKKKKGHDIGQSSRPVWPMCMPDHTKAKYGNVGPNCNRVWRVSLILPYLISGNKVFGIKNVWFLIFLMWLYYLQQNNICVEMRNIICCFIIPNNFRLIS